MNILIIFYSNSGNTKKVAELLTQKITDQQVQIKNALTIKPEDIHQADILVIGSPIHGYILFGQKFCKEIRNMITNKLPDDLDRKKVILFATYLFSPRNVLQTNKKLIESKNGLVIGLASAKRDKKEVLVDKLTELIRNS